MKRRHTKEYEHGMFSHFGLFFWQQCSGCHEDFRREAGHRFVVGPHHGGSPGKWLYVCATCAPSKAYAHEFAINRKYIGERPDAPPPPPIPPPGRNIKEGEQPSNIMGLPDIKNIPPMPPVSPPPRDLTPT